VPYDVDAEEGALLGARLFERPASPPYELIDRTSLFFPSKGRLPTFKTFIYFLPHHIDAVYSRDRLALPPFPQPLNVTETDRDFSTVRSRLFVLLPTSSMPSFSPFFLFFPFLLFQKASP